MGTESDIVNRGFNLATAATSVALPQASSKQKAALFYCLYMHVGDKAARRRHMISFMHIISKLDMKVKRKAFK